LKEEIISNNDEEVLDRENKGESDKMGETGGAIPEDTIMNR
jgi:hypothetical protein